MSSRSKASNSRSTRAEESSHVTTMLHVAESPSDDFYAAKREWSTRIFQPKARPGTQAAVARRVSAAVSPKPEHNVVGVGLGEKLVEGKATGVLAIKFLVRIKYPPGQLDRHSLLPKGIDGLPVDVEEVGLFRPLAVATKAATVANPRTRIRPAVPGCSIGFADPQNQIVMAGTFGALVQKANGTRYILSNNHVLADEGVLPLGSAIYQPGLLDEYAPARDKIAELSEFIPLQGGTLNAVDCAIAKPLDPTQVGDAILQIGPPHGVAAAALDMVVEKFGRTTGYRAGRVTSIDTDVTIGYDTGKYSFGGQIIVVGLNHQPFSDAGDSGSLIVERQTKKAIGLLFAGSHSHTIANHIEHVLAALQVELV